MADWSQPEILEWLKETRPSEIDALFAEADATRRAHVGDAVHLRGLIEISSYCQRHCMYCGLRHGNRSLARYRMSSTEILDSVRQAVLFGYGTVVLQAGEDDALSTAWIAAIVRTIKGTTSLAVTLSLGERSVDDLAQWRAAGADRYLLRFETSDESLYRIIHPARRPDEPGRIALLRALKRLGFEAGGGVMVGIPGQTYAMLARDIRTFRDLDLDMIGIGPYIPHPATPLGSGQLAPSVDPAEQVPHNEQMVYKAVALARLVCPDANLPSTTAVATINHANGRKQALRAGANVVMPNLTPLRYRNLYQIYPGKACIEESATDCNRCLRGQIHSIGRFTGRGPGARGSLEPPPSLASNLPPQLVELQG